MYWDPTYILVLIGAFLSLIATTRVNGAFNRYSKVKASSGITAQEAAMKILHEAGIDDVKIERIRGNLTDHYSPNEKVLRLSDSVYNSTSVAAIGVAAHECGHAIQHQVGYGPLKLRTLSVPVANIGSRLSWPIIIIGLILALPGLTQIGIFLFTFVVLFQLITLPVEINASRRALSILDSQNYLTDNELVGSRKVLKAAAYTYVAALLTSILQLLRIVILSRNRR